MPLELDDAQRARVVGTLRKAGCVFAEDEANLLCEGATDVVALEAMLADRVEGKPLELVLGWAEFRGLRIAVDPGVFVPRRRTAYLAHLASEFLTPGDIVVDLCCGAGAIGASLLASMRQGAPDGIPNSTGSSPITVTGGVPNTATGGMPDGMTTNSITGNIPDGITGVTGGIVGGLPSGITGRVPGIAGNSSGIAGGTGGVSGLGGGMIELHAADVDEVAVRCARKNLAAEIDAGNAFVYQGDLDAPLPPGIAGKVSVLTANVPYVPSAEIPLLPPEAREYEPLTALDGGADGLDMLRRVARSAPRWLRPGGRVLIEISDRQQDDAVAAFREAGLEPSIHESEDYYTTVLIGRRTGTAG